MYTINSRKKEIGIRKILGSSVLNIISILSKDFIRLILIAYWVAVPLAWWIMNRWLSDFAFRTELSWWVFVASGFLMLFIAVLTLSAQTLRAAIANPVKSLRTE
jgi:ABC-type antimicrobial peptide transport system permease subunit